VALTRTLRASNLSLLDSSLIYSEPLKRKADTEDRAIDLSERDRTGQRACDCGWEMVREGKANELVGRLDASSVELPSWYDSNPRTDRGNIKNQSADARRPAAELATSSCPRFFAGLLHFYAGQDNGGMVVVEAYEKILQDVEGITVG
jgi:hypothetical protein